MTLNKKEKMMIFVLIIIMIVGGVYTYGITPQNNAAAQKETELADLEQQLSDLNTQELKYSQAKYNNLVKTIEQIRAEIKDLTVVTTETEVIPSYNDLDGVNKENHKIAIKLRKDLQENGLELGNSITIATATLSDGKAIYTYSTSYKCFDAEVMMQFLDYVQSVNNYHITAIDFKYTASETGSVVIEGNLTIRVSFLNS